MSIFRVFQLSILFALMGFSFSTFGQEQTAEVQILRTNADGSKVLHAKLQDQVRVGESQTASYLLSFFSLSKDHELRAVRQLEISGEKHIRYQHYFKGIEVLGSEMIAHLHHGLLYSFNGELFAAEEQKAAISEEAAFSKARRYSGGRVFKWDLPQEEALYKLWKEDSLATYLPQGRLIYAPQQLDFNKNFQLCYVYEINADEPLIRKDIYVNALDGSFWAEEDLLHIADVQGTANTKYRGYKNITTDSVSSGSYRLREAGRGNGIETYNMQTGTSYAAAVDFTDTDNDWNNYNATFDEVAGDAHFGAEMTYDYYQNKFSRNSYDGNGAKIRSYVHYRTNYSNAFWNGSVMTYGDGNGISVTPLTSIDVCGHEVTHAVTTNSANLIYSYESGALNESFSDIFGNSIEYYADSTVWSWRIGEDIIVSGNGFRNMANPNTHGDPDTYLGTYWHAAATDNGGVHTNSGVQNFWFYLLCEGGSGTNDNADNYAVDSIGRDKSEAIAYRNLTVYLGRRSQYEDARYYGIQSAADLFGDCSDEVIATTNAWYAVGVGPEYDSAEVIADFIADTAYCFGSEQVQFYNQSTNAKAYAWDFGDGQSSTLNNPTHSYGQQGVFTVELIAEGCFFGVMDTAQKQNYITIDSSRDICNAVLMPYGRWDSVYSCNTYIYDHGGESDYTDLVRDTLTLIFAPSDSAHLIFQEFAYETDWDSIYIYDGYSTASPLIGGYTGLTLPNAGNPILLTNGAVTITHFSDPYVVDAGFKAHLISFRDSLSLMRSPDTLVCYKQDIVLSAQLSGGNPMDYEYYWNGERGDSTFQIAVERDTVIYLQAGDVCTKTFISDSIMITVRDSLKLTPMQDTTLCYLQTVDLVPSASGGLPSQYQYTWFPSGVIADTLRVQFSQDTVLSVKVEDGCTQQSDSLSFNIAVRDPITWLQSNDTTICQGTYATFRVDIQGGGIRPIYFTESRSAIVTTGTIAQPSLWITDGAGLAPGIHNFWISFTDQCTETQDTAHWKLTVRDSVQSQLSADTTICFGTSANLAVGSTGGLGSYTYQWDNGLSGQDKHTVSPSMTTTYSVQSSDGCSTYEPVESVTITVLDSLDVSITGPTVVCFEQPATLTAVVNGGLSSGYTYNWNSGVGNASTFAIVPTADSWITLAVEDGCTPQTASAQHFLRVRPPLDLQLTPDTAICLGEGIDLQATATGGFALNYLITWDKGLGTGNTKTVNPSTTTSYNVTLSDNCSSDDMKSVVVTVNPVPSVDFSANPNPTCTGVDIDFVNTGSSVPGSVYAWDFGDGSSRTTEDVVYAYSNSGLYTVKLTVTNSFGCSDSLLRSDLMEIQDHPVADFRFSPLKANYFEPDFDFTNESQFGNTYVWSFGDGGSSADQDPSYSYADTGSYLVKLMVNNDIGCTDEISKWVVVEDVFVLHVPTAFSPNSDGYNETYGVFARGIVAYHMIVFNRWGEILWEANDINQRWDGKVQGELIDEGIYFYLIQGVDYEGKAVDQKGEIHVLR